MHRATTKWRVDWGATFFPEVGQLVRHVTPKGEATFARVLCIRVVKTRTPLPESYVCRYALVVERLSERPADEPITWTFYAYPKASRRPEVTNRDRWSPLLAVPGRLTGHSSKTNP